MDLKYDSIQQSSSWQRFLYLQSSLALVKDMLVVFREIGKYSNVFQTLRVLRVLIVDYRESSIYHWEY